MIRVVYFDEVVEVLEFKVRMRECTESNGVWSGIVDARRGARLRPRRLDAKNKVENNQQAAHTDCGWRTSLLPCPIDR